MLPTLLIIDNDPKTLDLVEQTLAGKYKILRSTNSLEGLMILLETTVNLVILDTIMPGLDGFELCKIIKSNDKSSHIPVILLLQENTLVAKLNSLKMGADGYIDVPVSKDYLHALIDNILDNRRVVQNSLIGTPMALVKDSAHSKLDQQFLYDMYQIIENHLDDKKMNVQKLAKMMNLTRITLYRRVKALLDISPIELIAERRIRKAAALLLTGEDKVYEVSKKLGFTSQSNFSRDFQKHFKLTPTEFVRSNKREISINILKNIVEEKFRRNDN